MNQQELEAANKIKEIWRPIFANDLNAQEMAYLMTACRDETAIFLAAQQERLIKDIESKLDAMKNRVVLREPTEIKDGMILMPQDQWNSALDQVRVILEKQREVTE